MIKISLLYCILFSNLVTYGQCPKESISWIDSTGTEISPQLPFLYFKNNNAPFAIQLESLNLTKFFGSPIRKLFVEPKNDSANIFQLTTVDSEIKKTDYTKINCITCLEETMQKIDSVDVNKDGIKELIILRKGTCSSSPAIAYDCCGVGVKQQSASQYEIWDLGSNKCLYKIRNEYSFSETITVNVGYTDYYHFDLDISRSGLIKLSNCRGNIFPIEMGNYKFDLEIQKYILVSH